MNIYSVIKNLKWRLSRILFSKQRHDWHNVLFMNDDFKRGYNIPLYEYSKNSPIKYNRKKRVICIFDGKIRNGGLADRLRGIISIYEICKDLKIDFKIVFNSPFILHDYLVPNIIDWRIETDELNYNTRVTSICYIDTLTGTDYEAIRQKNWFKKEFKKRYKEYHVRSNAFFAYYGDYPTLFNDLFKPAPRLQQKIDHYKNILGEQYISTSFRFLDLLGDLNEPFGRKIILKDEEKEELITKAIEELDKLYKQHNKKILVNSDSITFLNRASILNYTYVIPGNVTHIDGECSSNLYYTFEKTFLDFFMIANAEIVFLLKSDNMHESGYPYAASLIYNKPFRLIKF